MTNKIFTTNKIIRMQHCDPGGVVFTPQYFNLFVEAIEDWFREGIGFGFPQMVSSNHQGIPAMKIIAKFYKPSKLGDILEFRVKLKRLRRQNILINVEAICNEERRCSGDFLHGFASLASLSLTDWPQDVHRRLEEYL
ncbi:acyl-CoA thioesterase [Leptospira licerasiae]|uniref:acyl-CoA thioesterase n=2 Tax=Leptospira licerasiae TaxID=447106 RepID=UPI00025A9F9D|nr:thioesterase family protein [Leptospira licerasiae]EIE02604.1 acyl-CoA thioester hydrolase, YbgC/YbaW family [Leptospira licerasiae serovar Varillal str. VAR 010]